MQGVLGAFRELDSAVHAIEDLRKQRVGDDCLCIHHRRLVLVDLHSAREQLFI